MRTMTAAIAVTVLVVACVTSIANAAALVEPAEVACDSNATDEGCTLEIVLEVTTGWVEVDGVGFWTRLYNGTFPGPTIRVRQNTNLTIHLLNGLGATFPHTPAPTMASTTGTSSVGGKFDPEQNCICEEGTTITPKSMSTPPSPFKSPNVTNLHLHGMHVDPSSEPLTLRIAPGESHTFSYTIPANHHVGTQWYHPHAHGSTALHVGGGLAGAFIVDDAPGSSMIADVPESVLVLQQVRFGPNPNSRMGSGMMTDVLDSRWLSNTMGDNIAVPESNISMYLVNGAVKPSLTIRPGEVHRLRLINAASVSFLELHLERTGTLDNSTDGGRHRRHGGADNDWFNSETDRDGELVPDGCEFSLVALDGMYLQTPGDGSSVPIRQIVMAPGNRADVLIRCNDTGMFILKSSPKPYNDAFVGHLTDRYEGDILEIEVAGSPIDQPMPSDIPTPVEYNLMDWRGELPASTPRDEEAFIFSHNCENNMHMNSEMGLQFCINGKAYDHTVAQHSFPLECVQDWQIVNHDVGMNHPWHMHVNHVQVIETTGHIWEPMLGNYMDTLALPSEIIAADSQPSALRIMFYPQDFTGNTVMHCHILAHGDAGMMMNLTISEPLGMGSCPAERETPAIPTFEEHERSENGTARDVPDPMDMDDCICAPRYTGMNSSKYAASIRVSLSVAAVIFSAILVYLFVMFQKRKKKMSIDPSLYAELKHCESNSDWNKGDVGVGDIEESSA